MTESPAVPSRPVASITLQGLRLAAITEAQCVEHVLDALAQGRGGWIVTPNLDHLRRYRADGAFAALIDRADLIVADGMPLIWASRLQGTPLPQRVAGSSLVNTLAQGAASRGRRLFLLGGNIGAAENAARVLQSHYPDLPPVHHHYPPPGFDQDAALKRHMIESLHAARPDIVYVALGSPKQEQLIAELMGEFPQTWWVGVGISLSFLSGEIRRAPRWMQRLGLEWLHRMAQEPRRLFKRYVIQGLPYAVYLLLTSALARVRQARRK